MITSVVGAMQIPDPTSVGLFQQQPAARQRVYRDFLKGDFASVAPIDLDYNVLIHLQDFPDRRQLVLDFQLRSALGSRQRKCTATSRPSGGERYL